MYRKNDRASAAPTVVEYESKRIRPGYLLLGVVMLLFGLGAIGGLHFSHIECSRTADADAGTCRVRRYGLFRSLDEQLSPSEVASFDVQVRTGSKGGKYAEIRLYMTRESHRNTIALETGAWGQVDPAKALEARSRFMAFQNRTTRSIDVWLSPSIAGWILITAFGLTLTAIGIACLREQLIQLRRIRIAVIPEREVVVVRGKEIPWSEIEDVKVAHGRALFWASGKNEHVPGFRLVFILRSGTDIPATPDYRAGDPNAHERARKTILLALGRDPN
mgnify:CR=1 FL=1